MRRISLHITLLLAVALSLMACDKTPGGVLSVDDMADLIVDMQLAEAYIDHHHEDFPTDSAKMVMKQSVFRKHGITQQDYDSSLVWYAHNMEDYTKAYDKAILKLNKHYEKIKTGGNSMPSDLVEGPSGVDGAPTHQITPGDAKNSRTKNYGKITSDANSDSTDLWQGRRHYTLTQGAQRGFLTFDVQPDAAKQPGDRYQLAYKLVRGGNDFKVSLNVDYTDGGTSQITRSTNSDGWVIIDVQSDTARQVRRVYGYVGYDIKRGQAAYVDSLMLIRTHLNKSNYGFIRAQRLLERHPGK